MHTIEYGYPSYFLILCLLTDNLGVVSIELQKPKEALEMFNNALKLDPEHLQSLMNSAILMQESGAASLRSEAFRRLEICKKRQPENDRIYFNLGKIHFRVSYTFKNVIHAFSIRYVMYGRW